MDDFVAGWEADLQPAAMIETTLLNVMVRTARNLRRVRILDAGLFDGATDRQKAGSPRSRCPALRSKSPPRHR
jgi:hypothetical protein